MYGYLVRVGYRHLWIFDNFGGNVMFSKTSYQHLRELNNYLQSMLFKHGTKTIHYTDILACD